MNTYKNNTPFPMVVDLKKGRTIIKPGQEVICEDELTIPGVDKVGFVREEALKEFPSKPASKAPEAVPITNILQSLFNARFGGK